MVGEIAFRGVTRMIEGRVVAEFPGPGVVQLCGTTSLDIRSFEVPQPTAFMLKIEPEVTVSLQLEARRGP